MCLFSLLWICKCSIQKVVLNGCHSHSSPVVSGVPQASILGPLYLSMISHLSFPVLLICSLMILKFFASSKAVATDYQNDLDSVHKWSQVWQLKFNISKCKLVHFGNASSPIWYIHTRWHLNWYCRITQGFGYFIW